MKTLDKSSCNLAALDKLKLEYGDFLLVVTQKGCGACAPALKMLKKTTKGKIPIVRLPAEQLECGDFAVGKLRVSDTPTIMLFKKGVIRPRKVEGEEQLRRFVGKRRGSRFFK